MSIFDLPPADVPPDPGLLDQLLAEAYPALAQVRQPGPPQSFLEGLGQGFVGGLASRGQRVAQQRALFYQRQRQRQAAVDQARIAQATATANRQGELENARTLATEKAARDAATKTAENETEYNRKHPILTDEIKATLPPGSPLSRVRTGTRVDEDVLNAYLKPVPTEKPTKEDLGPYGTYNTPNGPKVMRAGEAARAGFLPVASRDTRAPSAAEREQLTGDIGLLSQIGRVREQFKPNYVGFGHNVVGGAAQRVGAISRDEAGFRGGLAAIRNQILKLRSGGAVTEGEASRLLEELPTVDNPPDVFNAKMDQFENTFRTLAQTRREILSASSIDVSKFPELPQTKKPKKSLMQLMQEASQ